MEHQTLSNCLACGNTGVFPWLTLGRQPLANSFLVEPAEVIDSFLQVNYCKQCTHSQLYEVVNPSLLYSDYKYVSGTTATLRNHFIDLADKIGSYRPKGHYFGSRALDIGCNDGSLLDQLGSRGWAPHGVDPAVNLRGITEMKRIPVLVDFWSSDTAFKMEGNFQAIFALNCLAHNANPFDFLKGCVRVLDSTGVIVIEFPYLKSTLKLNDIGQFYAEHHSYFTAKSFTTLVERLNLRISHVEQFPEIHGGTVRFVLQKSLEPHCQQLRNLVVAEGNIEQELWDMADRLQVQMKTLRRNLEVCSMVDQKIVAYGASAKSSTLFNLPQIKGAIEFISYVVDDNPLKQGLFCPGSNLEIFSPEVLKNEDPRKLVVLLTVHNFKKEVIERLRGLGLKGALLLNYTPEILIEEI